MNHDITSKQRRLLSQIYDLSLVCGSSPTLEELKSALGYAQISSVQRHADALKKKGLIVAEKHRQRGLIITNFGLEVIGKNMSAEVYKPSFLPYQMPPSLELTDSSTSYATNQSFTTYENKSLGTNGTSAGREVSRDQKISASTQSQPSLFDGTSKDHRSLITVSNSTINLPFHSIDFSKTEKLIADFDYFAIVALSFILVQTFNAGVSWYFILVSTAFVARLINNYFKR